jgi:hypothetical protein
MIIARELLALVSRSSVTDFHRRSTSQSRENEWLYPKKALRRAGRRAGPARAREVRFAVQEHASRNPGL